MKILMWIIVWFFFAQIACMAADRHVSVFYYPWYDTDRHWGEGYMRRLLEPAQEPLLGHYSNRDNAVIERHVQWSQEYGIDNWICSWWGPTSWENNTILNYISPNLQETGVTYCVFYESAGLLNMQDGRIDFDEQRTATFRQHLQTIASRFFDDPAYYKIDGRPVVYIYLTRTFAGDYEKAIKAVRQDMADLGYEIFLIGDEVYWGSPNFTRIAALDAITAYNMHGPHKYDGYPAETHFLTKVSEKYLTYQNIASLAATAFIPKIMPGFNDRGVRLGADHYVIPNQVHPDSSLTSTFEHYAEMAEQFINKDLNAICITSFNEWHEDTQIEPTVITGTTNKDISPENVYTKGYYYQGYGMAYLEIIKDRFSGAKVRVEQQRDANQSFAITVRNYPNPFNGATNISFYLKQRLDAAIVVYDLSGRLVRQINLSEKEPGRYQAGIDLSDQPSGIYFYAVYAGGLHSGMKKMLLIK